MRHCRGISWAVISISQITNDVEHSLPIHMHSSFLCFLVFFFLTMHVTLPGTELCTPCRGSALTTGPPGNSHIHLFLKSLFRSFDRFELNTCLLIIQL